MDGRVDASESRLDFIIRACSRVWHAEEKQLKHLRVASHDGRESVSRLCHLVTDLSTVSSDKNHNLLLEQ